MGFMTGPQYQCQECGEISPFVIEFENEEDYSVKLPIVRKRGEMIYPIWNVRQMARLLSEEFK